MLFYYIGPASVGLTLRRRGGRRRNGQKSSSGKKERRGSGECTGFEHGKDKGGFQHGNLISYGSNNVNSAKDDDRDDNDSDEDDESTWPPMTLVIHASSIAVFDIFAQSMCYTGEYEPYFESFHYLETAISYINSLDVTVVSLCVSFWISTNEPVDKF